jgi:two-component system CheB/CheR fusion protein
MKASMTTTHRARHAGATPARTARRESPKDVAPSPLCDFAVVGLGASAGGLEAVSKLLDFLPADGGVAFVLIQHLDPTHKSLMVELLSKHTAMKVLQASDRMPLERDHVYVIPPQAYLSIREGALHLSMPKERHGARMPFDFFLNSLAEECGERAMCAILSGTGADGSLGLKAVKASGGLVIAQDPAEAAYDGMPRNAIMTGAVDLVLPVAKIPEALVMHRRHIDPNTARKGAAPVDRDHECLAQVIDLLDAKTSHKFGNYKPGTLLRRMERRMALTATKDSHRYLELLRKDDHEREFLAKDLLIHVTSFFRDPKAFEHLSESIIPELVRRQTSGQSLRVWVPACSTGEETYSIAMLFLEEIAAAKQNIKLQIFASDIDADAVSFARNGLYSASIEADVTPERLVRFFVKEGDGYRVTSALRDAVVFTVQDLLVDVPFSRIDLVSCRNLLIYLRPEVQEKVLALFHFALREGGVLFLGTAESVGGLSDRFKPICEEQRIYRHVGRNRPGEVDFPIGTSEGTRVHWPRIVQQTSTQRSGLGDLSQHQLLEAYAPASVLINRKHEGLYYFGPTDRYLRIAAGDASSDVIAMAREGLRSKLRAVIQRASQEQAGVLITDAQMDRDGEAIPVRIDVRRVESEGEALLLVSFVDGPKAEKESRRSAASPTDAPQIAELERELDATRDELETAARDLATSREEFKAINEEAMSVNEEYQSANEELETSKEELQSLNEELTALNSQLHETVQRLRDTSNDLQNILNSSDMATLFLDSKLNIRFFTPLAKSFFSIIESDIGRPLADLARLSDDGDLLADARAVLVSSLPLSREIERDKRAWYMRRILPYRTQDNSVEGVVITFADISETKAAESAIEAARSYSAGIVDTVRQPLVVLGADLCVISASRSFYRVFSVKPEETVGRQLGAVNDRHLDVPALRGFLDRLLAGETDIEDYEIEIELPSTGRRSLLMNAQEIRGSTLVGRQILVAIDDVTERNSVAAALEAARQQADRANRAKSRFLAAASHDLRQPLQTLSLLQGILAKKLKDDDSLRLVAKLDETLGAMSGMLNTLLDINQLEAGIVEPERIDFRVSDMLEQLKTEFAYHTESRGLDWRMVPCSLTVTSDRRLLEQMIRNLLSNAVKYTKRGKVLLGCRRRGNRLRIEVWDTGIGVPEEQIQAIFEEFHQLDNTARERTRGLGLGLSIVQRLADLLGHPIDVHSQSGKGSMFSVEVPVGQLSADKSAASIPSAAVHPVDRTGAILVIEDDPSVQEMLELLLQSEGHRTAAAADGKGALTLAARGVIRPDVIVADYNLPGGLNGLQVVTALRATLHREIPVVILTGDISAQTMREIAQQGCVQLNKPVRAEGLTRLIQAFLTSSRPTAAKPSVPRSMEPAIGPQPLTVFVVDDEVGVRDAMRESLVAAGRPVEVFESGEEFLDACRPDRKGCLILDAGLPGMSGLQVLERLKAAGHGLPVIMITGNADVPMATAAMKAGATDFIEKPIRYENLLAAIDRAQKAAYDSTERSARRQAAVTRISGLTEREHEIMDLVIAGHANKEIAARLAISQRTVENHRASVMTKTGVASLPDLIRLVIAAA